MAKLIVAEFGKKGRCAAFWAIVVVHGSQETFTPEGPDAAGLAGAQRGSAERGNVLK